jgi:hypothetical protein
VTSTIRLVSVGGAISESTLRREAKDEDWTDERLEKLIRDWNPELPMSTVVLNTPPAIGMRITMGEQIWKVEGLTLDCDGVKTGGRGYIAYLSYQGSYPL